MASQYWELPAACSSAGRSSLKVISTISRHTALKYAAAAELWSPPDCWLSSQVSSRSCASAVKSSTSTDRSAGTSVCASPLWVSSWMRAIFAGLTSSSLVRRSSMRWER